MTSALAGFATGLSLIVAIGAQNAFVLRQGLMRRHVLAIALFCATSDALLIALGVGGAGAAIAAVPGLGPALRWGGAAFLLAYGLRAWRSAWRGGGALDPAALGSQSRAAALAQAAAFTWLNPHVWLDTVVLLGAVSSGFSDRLGFAAGAITASFVFFFALAYGARLLAPLFARPGAWRVLDALVGALMIALAAGLALGAD